MDRAAIIQLSRQLEEIFMRNNQPRFSDKRRPRLDSRMFEEAETDIWMRRDDPKKAAEAKLLMIEALMRANIPFTLQFPLDKQGQFKEWKFEPGKEGTSDREALAQASKAVQDTRGRSSRFIVTISDGGEKKSDLASLQMEWAKKGIKVIGVKISPDIRNESAKPYFPPIATVPDISALPHEFARIIREAIDKAH